MHAPLYGYNQSPIVVEPSIAADTVPIRNNFITPEGTYRQMTVNEFFRTNRIPNQVAGPICNSPVRVSFLKIPTRRLSFAEEALPSTSDAHNGHMRHHRQFHEELTLFNERICFNIGREIYVFDYSNNLTNPSESAKPVDKRVYKGTFPTCHDFRQISLSATLYSCALLVGFSAGQIQLVDPSQKDVGTSSSKLFNEDRLIDKTAVTCLKWVPFEESLFAASHISGNIYFYNEQLYSPQMTPNYQLIKQDDHHIVYGCKSKVERNPVYRWTIGKGAINKFEFSGGDASLIAVANQDGFMRVFNWRTMDLIGFFKSYFGGLLCLAWSPDLRYIATGGEDDMLSLYSLTENRVVCRGQGHKSWIAEVAFDSYAPQLAFSQQEANTDGAYALPREDTVMALSSESSFMLSDDNVPRDVDCRRSNESNKPTASLVSPLFVKQNAPLPPTSNHLSLPNDGLMNSTEGGDLAAQPRLLYRVGTVGHDCQLCLWDISEDTLTTSSPILFDGGDLRQHSTPSPLYTERSSPRNTTVIPIGIGNALTITDNDGTKTNRTNANQAKNGKQSTSRLKRFHKRGLSLGSRLTGNDRWSRQNGSASNGVGSAESTLKREEQLGGAQMFGTAQCPRLDEVPVIEPLICKKVAHERLGALHFREDCIVTACQEGLICAWARPHVQAKLETRHEDGIFLNDGGALMGNCCGDFVPDTTC